MHLHSIHRQALRGICLLCLCGITFLTTAQSEATMLGEVIDIYNRSRDEVDQVRAHPKKHDVMDSIRDVSETAMERLRILKLSSDPGIGKTARYFYMNFKYNFAFGYAAVGERELARHAMVQPTSKQYSGLINFGFMAVKGIGADFFMGFGASYNRFNGDLNERGNDDYTIGDLMLQHRKDAYWNFIMRIGMSIGIGFAKE